MRDEDHWSVRRKKLAKCKIHGLHYDPRMTAGCAICRKEGLEAEPRKRPQLVVMLLALLGVAVIAYRLFGPGSIIFERTFAATTVPEDGLPRPAFVQLDPERYHPQIEALDRSFFETAGSLSTMRERAVAAADRLGGALHAALTPEGHAAGEDLEQLVQGLGTEEATTIDSLQAARQRWLDVRRQRFQPAPWFLQPTVGEADPIALTAYQGAAGDLLTLLDEGIARAQSLAEPEGWVPEADREARRQEWTSYRAAWRERIEATARRLPPRPGANAAAALLLAAQNLERAFELAGTLAAAKDLPREVAEGRPPAFDESVSLVEEARVSLAQLEGA